MRWMSRLNSLSCLESTMEPMLQYCLYDICKYYVCIVLYCKYITYRLYTYTRLCIKCGAIKTTELRRLIWHLSKKLFLHLDFFIQGSPQCQIWQGNVEEGVWAAHTAWRAAEREELGGCKLSPRSVQAPAKLGLCSAFPLFTTLPLPLSLSLPLRPFTIHRDRQAEVVVLTLNCHCCISNRQFRISFCLLYS